MRRAMRRVVTFLVFCSALSAPDLAGAQNLASFGHVIGSPTAPLEIVEFLDFGCDQCARFNELAFASIHDEFIVTGKVRWRSIPFVLGAFRNSAFAAEAAECAGEQGQYLAMHDSLLARRSEWSRFGSATEALATIARDAGLDGARFDVCVKSERMRPRVRAHKTVALSKKIYGTPTFIFPGDRRVLGAVPLAQFRDIVRAELLNVKP